MGGCKADLGSGNAWLAHGQVGLRITLKQRREHVVQGEAGVEDGTQLVGVHALASEAEAICFLRQTRGGCSARGES